VQALRAGDDCSPIARHDQEFNKLLIRRDDRFCLNLGRHLDKEDLPWLPETGFLSVFLAALPNIFSLFIFTHLVKLNRSAFNSVPPKLI